MKNAGLLKYILSVLILIATALISGCGSGEGDTASAAAVNVVSIVPVGAGKYNVQGSFSNVAGIEITISYDTAALANPQITQGAFLSETMFIPNVHYTQNSVRIAALSLKSISGNGTLATLSFEVLDAAPSVPVLVSVKLATPTGALVGSGNTGSAPDQPVAFAGNTVPAASGHGSVSGSSAQ